jgi:hypothetical protein
MMRKHYEEEGWLVVRNLLDPGLIARALDEGTQLTQRTDLIKPDNLRCRFRLHAQTGERLFEVFDPINDLSPASDALSHDPKLLALLGELYGEPAFVIKDKLIYKPPGCPGADLHQDYVSWLPRSFLTVLIPLETSNRENGCTLVYPGYHRLGPMTPPDGEFYHLPEGAVDESRAVALELEPGDVAVFGCFTPHRSRVNLSQRWRRQLYISYNQLSDGGEQRADHYARFHAWLRRRAPNAYFL